MRTPALAAVLVLLAPPALATNAHRWQEHSDACYVGIDVAAVPAGCSAWTDLLTVITCPATGRCTRHESGTLGGSTPTPPVTLRLFHAVGSGPLELDQQCQVLLDTTPQCGHGRDDPIDLPQDACTPLRLQATVEGASPGGWRTPATTRAFVETTLTLCRSGEQVDVTEG